MIKGGKEHKASVVDILSKSFEDNRSINYIVKQDSKRVERIKRLMSYCFEMCLLKGQIFLSEDKYACALILDSEEKAGILKSALLDLKLAIGCIGLSRVGKIMRRERMIKASQPKESFYYLWFIGVNPDNQGRGIGTQLLKEVFHYYSNRKRPFYLETSVMRNLPWYEKHGFKIYNEIDLGYKLYQMMRK